MEYRKFGTTILARLDKGEELLTQVKAIAAQEGIALASVQGLGAIDRFTVGVFHPADRSYQSNEFQGCFEIVSLTGTISTMDGAVYCHLHLSAGDEEGRVFGGHLNQAFISATCELVIQCVDGRVEREYSPEIGLNLFKFL